MEVISMKPTRTPATFFLELFPHSGGTKGGFLALLLLLFCATLPAQELILHDAIPGTTTRGGELNLSQYDEYNYPPLATADSLTGNSPGDTLRAYATSTDRDGDSTYMLHRFGYATTEGGTVTFLNNYGLTPYYVIPDSLANKFPFYSGLPKALTGGRTGREVVMWGDSVVNASNYLLNIEDYHTLQFSLSSTALTLPTTAVGDKYLYRGTITELPTENLTITNYEYPIYKVANAFTGYAVNNWCWERSVGNYQKKTSGSITETVDLASYMTLAQTTAGFVHPSVLKLDTAWNSYSYWMAVTPYWGSDDQYENPHILVSNNGTSWAEPAGISNPIYHSPPAWGDFNSDPYVYLANDSLNVLIRTTYQRTDTTINYLNFRSANGTTWIKTDSFASLKSEFDPVSPSVIYENGQYHLFAHDNARDELSFVYAISNDLDIPDEEWNDCVINNPPWASTKSLWHSDVQKVLDYFFCVGVTGLKSSHSVTDSLYFGYSRDGITWNFQNSEINFTDDFYKSAVQYTVSNDSILVDIWYGKKAGNWQVFHSSIYLLELTKSPTPTASLTGDVDITISWDDIACDSVIVYGGKTNNPTTEIGRVAFGTEQYTYSNLDENTRYYFRIKTKSRNSLSDYSATVTDSTGYDIGDAWEIEYSGATAFQLAQMKGTGAVTFYWGDGTYTDYTLTTSDQTISHTYADTLKRTIKVTNFDRITKLYMLTNAGKWGFDCDSLTNLTILYLRDSKFTYGLHFNSANNTHITELTFRQLTLGSYDITYNSAHTTGMTTLYYSPGAGTITTTINPADMLNIISLQSISVIGTVNFNYTAHTWSNSIAVVLMSTNVASGGFNACEIDAMFADLATRTWAGTKILTVNGTGNAQRSSASDADKTTLQGKGVTVTDNGNSGSCP